MAISTYSFPTNGGMINATKPRVNTKIDKIWKAEDTIEIPSGSSCNIVSYALANLDRYDKDHPASIAHSAPCVCPLTPSFQIFVDAIKLSDSFTAREVQALVRKLIAGLTAYGMKKGDCVCMHAFNTVWYPVVWLAVIGAGGILFGVNPAAPSSELRQHLIATNARYIITELESYGVIGEVVSSYSHLRNAIIVLDQAAVDDELPDGVQSLRALLLHGENDWQDAGQNDTAAYCTTSGTTGLPKAAKIPHSYIVAQCLMIEERFKSRSYQSRQLICLPVFHTFAAPIALVLPLRLGTTTYFLPRFSFEAFTRSINAFQITDTAIVPPILTALLRLTHDGSPLKSLRYILCAGAPITAAIQSQLYTLLRSDAIISQVWGATEVGWVTMFGPSERDQSGSVGTLLPGIQLKLGDWYVDGDVVRGEALIRTPAMYQGYLDNADATAAAFDKAGFYKTGDLVYLKDGKVFVDGRIKETIKVNGWQVSPSEIESVLLEHPQILDAAVVGVQGTGSGGLEVTRPRAYVVRSANGGTGTIISEQEVEDFVASKLVSYKQLTGGVAFVETIPRNPTGEILRRLLRKVEPKSRSLSGGSM